MHFNDFKVQAIETVTNDERLYLGKLPGSVVILV